jgi:hypothetical protein
MPFLSVIFEGFWVILGALGWGQVAQTYNKLQQIYALAVLADCLNAFAVGAPLLPTFRIRSGFLPAAF